VLLIETTARVTKRSIFHTHTTSCIQRTQLISSCCCCCAPERHRRLLLGGFAFDSAHACCSTYITAARSEYISNPKVSSVFVACRIGHAFSDDMQMRMFYTPLIIRYLHPIRPRAERHRTRIDIISVWHRKSTIQRQTIRS
jgi:hypothetical protein